MLEDTPKMPKITISHKAQQYGVDIGVHYDLSEFKIHVDESEMTLQEFLASLVLSNKTTEKRLELLENKSIFHL